MLDQEATSGRLDDDLLDATRLRTLSSIYPSAAHDLRAPLSAMVMNLELLDHAVNAPPAENQPREAVHYVGILRDELQRLQHTLDAFLEQAAPGGSPHREIIDLNAIIQDLCKLLSTHARHLNIGLDAALPDEGARVHGSADQIRQALLNVINNGFEAMSGGGVLNIAVRRHDDKMAIKIQDTGPGIPMSVTDRIFDRHFTTKTAHSGIGLYVARTVIENHGGQIAARSTPGEGACISIQLPAHPAPETQSEHNPRAPGG